MSSCAEGGGIITGIASVSSGAVLAGSAEECEPFKGEMRASESRGASAVDSLWLRG